MTRHNSGTGRLAAIGAQRLSAPRGILNPLRLSRRAAR